MYIHTNPIPLELASTTTHYPTFIYQIQSSPPDSRFSAANCNCVNILNPPSPSLSLFLSALSSVLVLVHTVSRYVWGKNGGKQGTEASRHSLTLLIPSTEGTRELERTDGAGSLVAARNRASIRRQARARQGHRNLKFTDKCVIHSCIHGLWLWCRMGIRVAYVSYDVCLPSFFLLGESLLALTGDVLAGAAAVVGRDMFARGSKAIF